MGSSFGDRREGERLGHKGFGIALSWDEVKLVWLKSLKLAWKRKCPAWWRRISTTSTQEREPFWGKFGIATYLEVSLVFKRYLKCGSRKHLRGCWAGPSHRWRCSATRPSLKQRPLLAVCGSGPKSKMSSLCCCEALRKAKVCCHQWFNP